MPVYEHICDACSYEWEQEYSIKEDPPKNCPKCNEEKVKRLISLGGKGVVQLTGNELIAKLKDDANKIKKEASMDEKKYSNLIGERHYQNLQSNIDKKKRERH